MTQTTTDNLLDLDETVTEDNAVVPAAELSTVEEAIASEYSEEAVPVEEYQVTDLYPEVELPESTLAAISSDETLWEIQSKIDYLNAELEAAQNKLRNRVMDLQNQAKAELLAAQQAADEALVINALEQPEMMRVLASVLRIMNQRGKAGILLETLETIENGSATNAMTRLATTIAPVYHEPAYEPSAYVQEPAQEVPAMEPIKTTPAPAAKTKWKPD